MSSLKDKLYNYEQAPPINTWDKIAAALDESHMSDEFPSRLYHNEVVPPAAAWDKITSALDSEDPKVIPMKGRGFSFFRYAAAAVVIGLAAFGVIKWVGSDNTASSAADKIAISKEHPSADNSVTGSSVNSTPVENTNERENLIAEDNSAHTAAIGEPKPLHIKRVKDSYSITNDMAPAAAIYAYNEHTPNLADRYVMLMTSNGIVRMSKKLGNIVCCVAGEEQDEDCKDQIKKWQEKIAASPIAPAPGNFMDILSLLSSLNENEL